MTSDRRENCRRHFYTRVRERIGDHVDPGSLADVIIALMEAGGDSPGLRFITRLDGRDHQRRVWRIKVAEKAHFIIFDHSLNTPVTVLPPSYTVKRYRGSRIRHIHLENYL